MENRMELFDGPVDGMPSPTLLRRAAALTAAMAAVVALTTWHTSVSAVESVQTGPAVTVTASRDALTTSETAYVDAVHRKLQAASRYPTSREASLERPSGTTMVWAEVSRDGRVKGRGVEQSSGSQMLDNMAKSLVGRGRYPTFAAGDWGGAPTHRFVVSYRFDGVAMTGGKASNVAAR